MPYPPQVAKGRGDFKGDFKGSFSPLTKSGLGASLATIKPAQKKLPPRPLAPDQSVLGVSHSQRTPDMSCSH